MNLGQPGGFSILPPIVKNLIIINVIMFMASWAIPSLTNYFALYYWESPLFRPWQILTHIFMHANFGHLFFNMFALWMFGNMIENTLGPKRFLIFYLVCGLGAAFLHMMVFFWENAEYIKIFEHLPKDQQISMVNQIIQTDYGSVVAMPMVTPMVGASGAIFGVLFAFGYLYPNLKIYIYMLLPLKAKYFVAIYAALELIMGLRNSPTDNVAHFAHLGGMVFAFIIFKVWKIRSNPFRTT